MGLKPGSSKTAFQVAILDKNPATLGVRFDLGLMVVPCSVCLPVKLTPRVRDGYSGRKARLRSAHSEMLVGAGSLYSVSNCRTPAEKS